jgi:small subunit ribosomal protein S20
LANIKSQIKRNRQNDKKRLRNRVYRGEARIAVRTARSTIEEGVPESKVALLEAISSLDKAAAQGVIHKNNAARRKSRLMKAYAKMEPVQLHAEPSAEDTAQVVEPVLKKKAAPKASAGKGKAAQMKKNAEVKAEAVAETKAEPKKKAVVKKPVAKKAAEKKPAAKKAAEKKTGTTKKTPAKK